jgi:Leucine-rich repeat (LRR) protein
LQLDSTRLKSLNGIGNCPSLVDVDVRFNQLSGPLSTEIASLSNLETFFCGDNALSGPLPSFETNRRLTTLRVGGNAFSGQLPSFDVHPNLKTLDVSNNQLSGEIPNDFFSAADASKPVFIDISSNLISGTIPGSLSRLSEVTLYARDNKIQGIHPDLCLQDSWNAGDVGLFGCDAILCPPSSYSPLGRASDNDSTCLPCKQTVYFGSSECSALRGSSAWSNYLLSRYVVGVAALGFLVVL